MLQRLTRKRSSGQTWYSFGTKNYDIFTENIGIKKLSVEVKKDPKDSAILETLIMSHCDYLVTGDKMLLELSKLHSIISLAEFYNILFGFPQNF